LGNTYYAITDAPWVHRINSDTLDTVEYHDMVKMFGLNASTGHPHFGTVTLSFINVLLPTVDAGLLAQCLYV